MTNFADSLPGLSTSVALALIFWRVLKQALDFHRRSLHEQRLDMLQHMETVCRSRQHAAPPADKPPLLPLAAVLCLSLLPGCTAGQGGTVGDFALTTPLGSVVFKTWVVTPSQSPIADVGGGTPLQPPQPSTRPAVAPPAAVAPK